MAISEKDVKHVAWLARLAITDAEVQKFAQQLDVILEHAGKIAELDTENIPPTSHAIPLRNVLREDTLGACLTPEAALSNAPKKEDQAFVVPRIV
ncbi:MAG TPA: Asp-tRNA(Asn)/Glu-tRNA(Gln) amidotransferase subunit GatC [Anaerolineae bacterium]|jgi:aspartyl-tRNA(Asn)/glutamyl-tRNA(Gln) amidotransferase subunit C|nr:Asp-tRNA(Asn)/Glu-tRNA(Gln) amidotransferase subunit GatC [Anaerolineae bacterium]